MVSVAPGPPRRSPAAAPEWDSGPAQLAGAGLRQQPWEGVESRGARAGLGSPGGAALCPVGGGRAELGSGRLDPAGFGGLGVADSVRGPLVRFWVGASGNPWTRLGLETLGWFRKGVGGNLKRLDSVGPECPGPLRW